MPDDVVVLALVTRVAHGRDVPAGGWMYCPQCDWHATWSLGLFQGDPTVKDEIGPWSDDYRTIDAS